ncbi:MAG: CbiX/SirB N-terminal domain-containing protein [Bacteroidia bacterium]|nr:CbiX/SirB N-terminal domain-containing protein [Bacteroidia bacterium]
MKKFYWITIAAIIINVSLILISTLFVSSCSSKAEDKSLNKQQSKKIGILLVNHGSRSETWRNALLDLEKRVKDSLLRYTNVSDVKTAFMEYTEPSIATRLKQMDSLGVSDIIIVPVFLTVSPHTFEDIPTIVGMKENPESMELLKMEKIERYTPKAKVHITPLLDFTDILKKNVLSRARVLSTNPDKESIVLIGYGDERYLKEWENLFAEVGKYVNDQLGIKHYEYGWCGHLVKYNPEETTKAVNKALEQSHVAIVIPVLVAHDEMFQIKIIGGGIEKVKEYTTRVKYKPDAILPDAHVENWIKQITKEFVQKINSSASI